jgi:hypothetical protein
MRALAPGLHRRHRRHLARDPDVRGEGPEADRPGALGRQDNVQRAAGGGVGARLRRRRCPHPARAAPRRGRGSSDGIGRLPPRENPLPPGFEGNGLPLAWKCGSASGRAVSALSRESMRQVLAFEGGFPPDASGGLTTCKPVQRGRRSSRFRSDSNAKGGITQSGSSGSFSYSGKTGFAEAGSARRGSHRARSPRPGSAATREPAHRLAERARPDARAASRERDTAPARPLSSGAARGAEGRAVVRHPGADHRDPCASGSR